MSEMRLSDMYSIVTLNPIYTLWDLPVLFSIVLHMLTAFESSV